MLKLYVALISRFTCLSSNWSSGHMCTFIDVYMCATFFPAKLAAVSLLFFFFFILPSGRGQAGSEEGSQGRGERDPHEGAGETAERGISQEYTFTCKTMIMISWTKRNKNIWRRVLPKKQTTQYRIGSSHF